MMRIGELESRSGIPRSRIHYYILEGLLHPPRKTGKTMAYYDDSHLARIEEIERLKMELLQENNKFRVPSSLLRYRLKERHSNPSATATDEISLQEMDLERGQRRKAEILETAQKLFFQHGYYHTSLRDIAREVGISPSAIYLYFPDKRELFAAVIQNVIESLNRDVRFFMTQEGDPLKNFRSFFQVYLDYYPKLGEIVNQLRAGIAINDHWALDNLRRIYFDISSIAIAGVKVGMEVGLFRELDPELLAYYLIAVTESAFRYKFVDGRRSNEEAFALFFDVVYNGIGSLNRGDQGSASPGELGETGVQDGTGEPDEIGEPEEET